MHGRINNDKIPEFNFDLSYLDDPLEGGSGTSRGLLPQPSTDLDKVFHTQSGSSSLSQPLSQRTTSPASPPSFESCNGGEGFHVGDLYYPGIKHHEYLQPAAAILAPPPPPYYQHQQQLQQLQQLQQPSDMEAGNQTAEATQSEPSRGKHKQKSAECHICNKRISSSSNLKAHIKTHTNESPYKCPFCSKRYKRAKSLTLHLLTNHRSQQAQNNQDTASSSTATQANRPIHHVDSTTVDATAAATRSDSPCRPHKCQKCKKCYQLKSSLDEHIKSKHNISAIHCDQCNYQTSKPNNLAAHKRSHTKEKPFTCPLCQKKFSQKGSLNRHLSHHKDKSVK